MTKIGSVFLPVSDTRASAEWFAETFDMRLISVEEHAAVLQTGASGHRLSLLGPASGISSPPGLPWAPFNLLAEDLPATHDRLTRTGGNPSDINGDTQTCFWFTATDPDQNTLLIVDR